MTLLCFLIDLRTLPPSLLRDLKQSLLQLANLYVISSGRGERVIQVGEELRTLPDNIVLSYLHRNRILQSDEVQLKVAYAPRGNFNLRSFHHAVNSLPTDCFLRESANSDQTERSDPGALLARLLNDKALYSWGEKDISKKVICVGSSLVSNNEVLRKTLIEAAEKCISVEFVVLEHNQNHVFSEELDKILNSITDMENCTIQTYIPSSAILCGLVKRWLQDMKNDADEPIQAVFHFKNTIIGTINQIVCNLSPSCKDNLDDLRHCQACRCHGYPITNTVNSVKERSIFCRVSRCELGSCEMIEQALIVGDQTVLLMPSFHIFSSFKEKITHPIVFNVMERTNLASLNEGAILGGSHIVLPSASLEMEMISDEFELSELNSQAFYGLCRCLFLSDQGLICSSICNTESMKNAPFQCFYLLQPSSKGTMLLRRLAASEEIWPIPQTIPVTDVTLPDDLLISIRNSLSKVELRDYNPLHHERGFHHKLNALIKESLHLGSIPTEVKDENSLSATQEWEEIVLANTAALGSKIQHAKPVDDKTSKILERLEAPTLKKGTLPMVTKKPDGLHSVNGPGLSQPLRPVFQRLKKTHK